MVKRRIGFRSIVAMALCAFLALAAFLGFLILVGSSQGALAFLGLTAALACPAVWLVVLLSDSGGRISAQQVRRANVRLRDPTRSESKQ